MFELKWPLPMQYPKIALSDGRRATDATPLSYDVFDLPKTSNALAASRQEPNVCMIPHTDWVDPG